MNFSVEDDYIVVMDDTAQNTDMEMFLEDGLVYLRQTHDDGEVDLIQVSMEMMADLMSAMMMEEPGVYTDGPNGELVKVEVLQ